MASATGIPAHPTAVDPRERGFGDDEPLLGQPGDASQQEGWPLWFNLGLGTAVITQVAIFLLVIHVWASIFFQPLMLFTAHPTTNTAGLLFLVESILIVQPTHTPTQKKNGTVVHLILNATAFALFLSGLIVIEVNKVRAGNAHFYSPHAILGLITYILIFLQVIVGFTQYYTPQIYGGVDNAKAIYKYHRLSGYVILVVILMTVSASAWTTFNIQAIHIKNWALIITSVLILVGIWPRVRLQKFGIRKRIQI